MSGDDSILGLPDILFAVEDERVDQRNLGGGMVRKVVQVLRNRLADARPRLVRSGVRVANGGRVVAGSAAVWGRLLYGRVCEAHPRVLLQTVGRLVGPALPQ